MQMDQQRQIRAALDEILQSSGFSNSAQMQNFLQFIVSMTLEGRETDIKGYTIGVDALGKDESFDPTTDPSVRVLAGRLRQALTSFYVETPDHLSPKIDLPKGKYVPVFEWPDEAEAAKEIAQTTETNEESEYTPAIVKPEAEPIRYYSALLVSIAALVIGLFSLLATQHSHDITGAIPPASPLYVEHTKLPLIQLDISHDEEGFPDWISPQLAESRAVISFSRFNEYRFTTEPLENDRVPPADYKIEVFFSSVEETQDLEAFITIKRGNTGEIIWSGRDLFTSQDNASQDQNRKRVGNLVSPIMSPYGIIHGDIVNREVPPPRLACIRNIYEYFYSEELQTFSNGVACANEALTSENTSSSMYAMMTFLKVEAYRRNLETGGDDPLLAAREFADEAVKLDEANARAYQARFAVEKASGNREGAIQFAKAAIERNPFDRDIIGDFAAYLISIEELEQARKPLETALALSPRPPAWLIFYHYLYAELTGDFLRADKVAEQITINNSPLLATALLLAAERTGDRTQVAEASAVLQSTEPGFLANPEAELLRRGLLPSLAERLSERVKRVTTDM